MREGALAGRSRAENVEFYRALYEANIKGLTNYAYRRIGDYYLAEDLANEAMLVAWARIDEVREKHIPAAWLYKVMKNLLRREMAKKRYRAEMDLMEKDLAYVPTEQDWNLLESIPEALPEKKRAILELRYREGLSYEEIALRLGLSESAARRSCARAIQECRRLLAGEKHTKD